MTVLSADCVVHDCQLPLVLVCAVLISNGFFFFLLVVMLNLKEGCKLSTLVFGLATVALDVSLLTCYFLFFFNILFGAVNKLYPGLYKILTKSSTACCVDCFHNELKPLASCVVSLRGFNNSNCKQHMDSKHKDDLCGKTYRMHLEESEDVASTSITRRGPLSRGPLSIRSVGEESAGQAGQSGTHPFGRTKIPKMIIQRGNDLQLQFMRSCNVAACHGNSPDLKNFLDHIVENAYFYSKNKNALVMGRQKVANQRYRSFNQLVGVVKMMVSRSRTWLLEKTQRKSIPFLTVGHDGWDSKDKDMLGVCVHFVDMEKGKKRSIALGLQQCHSKKSAAVAEHVFKMLERYVLDCVFMCFSFSCMHIPD